MLETCKFYIGFGGNHVEFHTSSVKKKMKGIVPFGVYSN